MCKIGRNWFIRYVKLLLDPILQGKRTLKKNIVQVENELKSN